jgi:hypothetical protein
MVLAKLTGQRMLLCYRTLITEHVRSMSKARPKLHQKASRFDWIVLKRRTGPLAGL